MKTWISAAAVYWSTKWLMLRMLRSESIITPRLPASSEALITQSERTSTGTCEVLWSARLNTSKVTGNRQEDRSRQWEATKRSVGLSAARVVGAHRDRYQRRWMTTVRHLICVNVRRMGLDDSDRNGNRHRNTSMTVEVVWRVKTEDYEVVSAQLLAFACLQSLV